jgi:serine/threonine-protein kinase
MKPRVLNGRPALGATIAYQADAAESKAKPRCRFARSMGTGTDSHGELHKLLHSRLRFASLLTALPFLFFLVKTAIDPTLCDPLHPNVLLLSQVGATALITAITAYIWVRRIPCWGELRTVEIALFGTVTAYFTWLHYFTCGMGGLGCDPVPQNLFWTVFQLATAANSLRWWFLIIVYGVFIPNTWRRCALLTVSAGLIPIVLTVVCGFQRNLAAPELLSATSVTVVVMALAVAVAVFGSYRIQLLQQEASEARQLGQYRLKKQLGSGGMGEVYLAEHTLLRRPCAVKLILPEQTADPTTLQRFEREVRAMATLTHWNTVEIFDYGHAEDGTFYYVMEYLPGKNLDSLVTKHGPLPAARAIHFLRQVCRALREAHGIGLLHRDIKPSNVIACERGGVYDVAKLLDFGLVQSQGLGADAEKLTVVGAVLGSPPYMSPEQAAGRENLDARSDIYSLGAVAYFLLTGQAPFVRDTAMEMLLAHAYEAPRSPSELRPDVPRDLEDVVLRCLKKKPEERYPDADSLEKALAACADGEAWTEESAAAWWSEARFDEKPDTNVMLPAATVQQGTTG